MELLKRAPWFVALLVPLWLGSALAEAPPKSGNRNFDRAVEIVLDKFYDLKALEPFKRAVGEALGDLPPGKPSGRDYAAALDKVLASLGASHTGHFTPDTLEYYELADIFRFNYRGDLRRLFPPEGKITYPGIGIATALIDGKRFVTDVYDGSAAAKAGVMVGDEILSVDGAPFTEIEAFRNKVGKVVMLSLRRRADADPIAIAVPVARLQPSETLIGAIEASARVVERGGRRIGTVRIWSFAGGDAEEALEHALSGPVLKDADALIVDLRGRWGGAPPDAAEVFLGGTPSFRFIERNGEGRPSNIRWQKPVVAVIDEGTRSGLEVFAYALKSKGIPLVGTRTAGALLGGRGFLLPDDTLLELAVVDVEVDGKRLEGVGVEPDVRVPFDIRYAAGRDPQFDAAVEKALSVITEG